MEQERTLRQHLVSCDACRAHYDRLTLTHRALFGAGAPTQSETDRSLARLLDAVEPPAARRAPARWLAAAATVAAAVFALLLLRPASSPTDITWRGAADAESAPIRLRIYARDPAGARPLQLAAELPLSGEGRVGREDLVQFAFMGERPGHVYVLIDDVLAFPGTQAVAGRPVPLGEAVVLGARHPNAAQLRLRLVWSSAPMDPLAPAPPGVDSVAVDGVLSFAP